MPTRGSSLSRGGTVVVTAGGDAIEAESLFTMTGGQAQLVSGGGSVNGAAHAEGNWGRPGQGEAADETDEVSAKGIKASGTVEIADGVLIVDSADDAIHSNDSLLVSGGTLRLTSGDDGMHADAELTITGGDILITQSYEGIESAIIVIDGGRIEVTAAATTASTSRAETTARRSTGDPARTRSPHRVIAI